MRSWGLFLIISAIGSAVLPYIGVQFILLMWIDSWGVNTGWAIRGAILAMGIAMLVMDSKQRPFDPERRKGPPI